MKIEQKLNSLMKQFGEPIAVALIVDEKGISIRKARKLGPHLITHNKKQRKAEEFNEEEVDDVNFETFPNKEEEISKLRSYLGWKRKQKKNN